MKGLVFVLLRERLLRDYGDEAWEDTVEQAGLDGDYEVMEDYPYEHLGELLAAAEPYTGHAGREAQRWFGRRALLQLAGDFFHLFRDHGSTVDFAAAINEQIHPHVEESYPGAELPILLVDESPREGDLRLRYDSERGLCSFAEGILEGVGNLYGEKVTIQQPCCVHEGHPYCDLVLTVEGAVNEGPFDGMGEPDLLPSV